MNQYGVWYMSAGALPDGDEPEFEGTLEECQAWMNAQEDEYFREDVEHDLYKLVIDGFWIQEV